MMKKIAKMIQGKRAARHQAVTAKKRKILVKKVEQGTDFVIQQYGEALRKLGAYDRQ